MKQTLKIFAILGSTLVASLASTTSYALTADQFDYGTYFRTGIGSNNKGGNQTCFSNPYGSGHNDFRLGNECGTYSELKLRGTSTKGKTETDPYFAAETMLSFGTPNAVNEEQFLPAVRELYIEGGNLFGEKQTYWVGKRYYRDIDAHMDDFFYYAGITGNGAGVTHIDTGWGQFAAAWFIASPRDTAGTVATASTDNSQSHYLDFRLSDAPLSESQDLNLWLGLAAQKNSDNSVSGHEYGKFGGAILGARHRLKLEQGNNDFAVMYGNGLLSRFTIDNITGFVSGDPIGRSNAIRVVDHVTKQFDTAWAFHAVGIYEHHSSYFTAGESGDYWSVGVRPVYFLSDHFHLAVELGHDFGKDGSAKSISLTRFTIAPELVAARDIWSRPSLRLFYTTTFWNDAGKGAIGGPAYAGNTSGSNFGAQAEIWF